MFIVAALAIVPAGAQNAGPHSAFSARGGVLSMLASAQVQRELGLSEKQVQKLSEVRKSARPPSGAFAPLFEKLGQAQDDAARDAVRAEMVALTRKFRAKAESQLPEILSEQQQASLVEMAIGRAGADALSSPLVVDHLELTKDQRDQLATWFQDRQAARADDDPTSRDAFQREWDEKLMALLSDEQRAAWQALVPAEDATGSVAAGGAPPKKPAGAAPAMPAKAATSEAPSEDPDKPVASFGAEDLAPGERGAEPRSLSFNFHQAPWTEVLSLFADYANLTLDLVDVPPGTFSYRDEGSYTPTEALDVLNGYLLRKGYILVRRDRFLICLNIDNGIPPNLVPNITVDELARRGENELLGVVFPIEGVPAANVATEVELLLGPQGEVVPLTTSNSLVVTDIGSNLQRIRRLLETVSQAGLGEEVFKSYPLVHLDPEDAEQIVKGQLGLEVGTKSVSSAYEDWRRRRRDDDDDRGDRRRPAPTSREDDPKVMADRRTGSLLVTAEPGEHRIVEEVLKATDVPQASGYSRDHNDEPYLEVYTLYDSDPQEVVKTLDVLMPGVVVNEDGRNEKIHVHAPEAVQEEVRRLIARLDGEGGDGDMAVTVIPLSQMDPYAAATSIQSLFMMEDDDDMPMIEADVYGSRLLVRGTQAQVEQVKTLLAQMGEDGTGLGRFASGPVRTIPLGGRDPEELVPILRQLWETSSAVPIRIVPASPGMIIETHPLGETDEATSEPVSQTRTRGNQTKLDQPAANFAVADPLPKPQPPDDGPAPEVQPVEAPIAKSGSPAESDEDGMGEHVTLAVQGGNLVLASENEAALDHLQSLVSRLGEAIPPRTKWTVFYLRSADATETAMLLEQIFPTSSVSTAATDSGLMGSLTRGLSSFGGDVMGATGLGGLGLNTQELRMIPDIRSNSLFVSGPPHKVAEVEQVLMVIDKSDLPDSLRERLPRMIEVKYADVEAVAEIVRDVYKDYLEPVTSQPAANPLALLMGGGRGRGGDRDEDDPKGKIRLTVGVDTATSQLIVSADETLFQEIEGLVARLDQAQRDARRTVRVVTLENAEATMVSATLGSLIPKVRTSSTADRRSQSRDSDDNTDRRRDNDNGDANRSQEEAQERLRRYMEWRNRFGRGGDDDRGGRDRGDRDRGRFRRDRD